MPFFFLYIFSDFIRFIMRNILGYRRKVILQNLKNAFPNKKIDEIRKLERKAYKNLIDNIVEGVKTFSMSKTKIVRHHRVLNPEIIEPFLKNQQSIIGVTAHYNNWEWGSLSASLQTPYDVVAFYKPLSNKHIDRVLRKSRSRCGTELVSIYKTSKAFEKYSNEPTLYLMAADQSPSKRELGKAFWFEFLGIKTAFLHGLEKHAKNNNYPVIYIDIQRVRRGYYELELSVLSDNPASLKEGELTKKYVNKLESVILKQPENWLWSHKRWKHSLIEGNNK